MDEFDLIQRFFAMQPLRRPDVSLGIGDDAAVLRVPDGQELVASVDSLVAGVHFIETMDAEAVGHRALAVNLSDLAAMGAEPAWALLALSLPAADEGWLAGFARGFFALAGRYSVALVGGNTVRGPLSITVTVHGFVPRGMAITRAGARPGDHIYVTGESGAAAAGLRCWQEQGMRDPDDVLLRRFLRPEPRVPAGLALRGIASAAIDVSDGFTADLGHILVASGAGANVSLESLPLAAAAVERFGRETALRMALSSGDDYELCFTVPPQRLALFETRRRTLDCAATHIGEINATRKLRCVRQDGSDWAESAAGYKHF
ncbi:MAG: thiamine-phosphate kinase [Gammaproteobacteria bacterium]|nr:thiamine-phosphate kinase [Gammaproteobacteria bacterium]